jgi:hypothetical protein
VDKEEIIENNITKVIKSSDDVEMKKITFFWANFFKLNLALLGWFRLYKAQFNLIGLCFVMEGSC